MVNLLIIAAVLILLAAVAFTAARLAKSRQPSQAQPTDEHRYIIAGKLLTPTEHRFFETIRACGFTAHVCPKVRVADVLTTPAGMGKGAARAAFLRISQKHFDFVLIDPTDSTPLVAIELDDKTHRQADRVMRDDFLDRATSSARLPLVRIKAQARYSPEEIRSRIHEVFQGRANPPI